MQDPTEFRKRFLLYKEGKMPYENGLPKYLDGRRPMSHWDKKQSTSYRIPFIPEKRIKLTNAGLATGAILSTNLLDSIADNAYKANIPIKTAIGLATKESTLGNPTDDTTIYKLLSDPEKIEWFKQQGTGQYINNGKSVEEQSLVNYHKGDTDHSIFKGDNNESILKTAFDFYKENPDKYNPGLKNYQKLVNKRGDEVMNSPEVLKWYKEWEDKLIQIKRPEPYLIQTTIQNTAAPEFGKYANGKLPMYKIGHNVSNAKLNEDGAFTDDYTKVFEDMYVTPQKTDLKRGSYTLNNFPYYLQHRSDWTKPFMSSGTNETGLELVNPEFDILLGGRQLATEIFKPFSKNANEIAKELNRGIEQNTILRNYNKVPANKDIGSAYDYLDFLDNIYPNSKINGVFYHGGPKGIQKFKSAKELGSTNKNINSGTKNHGIYLADDEGLALYYAQGFKKRNREVYNVRVNAESPIRYETDNWYLDKFVGNEDLRFRPGSITDKWYDKLNLKTKDAIYHTKSSNSLENGELVVFDGDNIHIMGTPKESEAFKLWKQNPIYVHKPILDQIPLLPQLYDKSLKNYAKASIPGLFLGGITIAPYLLYSYEKNRRKRYKRDDNVKPTTLKFKQTTE